MFDSNSCVKNSIRFTPLLFQDISVEATPRLAAKYGQYCFLCRRDPGGAGMRNSFGSRFISVNDLPMIENGVLEESWPFQTGISDNISIGGDFRALS